MGNIKRTCETSQLPFIEKDSVSTSKLMWEELKKVHQTSLSKINIHYLFEELYTRKYVDGASMDEHIAAMLDLSHQIVSASEKLEDLHLARAMVLLLPKTPSWELVKIPLFELVTLTSETVSTRLLQEANHCNAKNPGLNACRKKGNSKGKSKDKGPQPTNKCHCCRKQGHWAKDCKEPEVKKGKENSGSDSAHLAVSKL